MRLIKSIGTGLLFLLVPLGSYAEEMREGELQNGVGFIEAREWNAFVNKPTQKNYFALGKLLANCKKDNLQCEKKLHPHYNRSEKLIDLALKGNKRAIDITFASLRFLGGGELGDAMRALGQIIESDPELFFRETRMHGISTLTMEGIVIMTPLELTDLYDLQLEVLRKRHKSASSLRVEDPFLAPYQDKAIKSLQDRIVFFEKKLKDWKKSPER